MSAITHPAAAPTLPSASRLDKRRYQWGSALLVLPAGILIAAVFVYGVGYSIYLGFTNLSLLGPTAEHPSFTGTANITQSAVGDKRGLWTTVISAAILIFE